MFTDVKFTSLSVMFYPRCRQGSYSFRLQAWSIALSLRWNLGRGSSRKYQYMHKDATNFRYHSTLKLCVWHVVTWHVRTLLCSSSLLFLFPTQSLGTRSQHLENFSECLTTPYCITIYLSCRTATIYYQWWVAIEYSFLKKRLISRNQVSVTCIVSGFTIQRALK